MKVENTSKVTLTPEEVKNIIVEHLKEKHIIKDGEQYVVAFDIKETREGEDMFSPGYTVHDFNGCEVRITRK